MKFVCYCPDSTSGQVAISADPATVAGLNIPGKGKTVISISCFGNQILMKQAYCFELKYFRLNNPGREEE